MSSLSLSLSRLKQKKKTEGIRSGRKWIIFSNTFVSFEMDDEGILGVVTNYLICSTDTASSGKEGFM